MRSPATVDIAQVHSQAHRHDADTVTSRDEVANWSLNMVRDPTVGFNHLATDIALELLGPVANFAPGRFREPLTAGLDETEPYVESRGLGCAHPRSNTPASPSKHDSPDLPHRAESGRTAQRGSRSSLAGGRTGRRSGRPRRCSARRRAGPHSAASAVSHKVRDSPITWRRTPKPGWTSSRSRWNPRRRMTAPDARFSGS